jgi:predicted Zn-dependent protease
MTQWDWAALDPAALTARAIDKCVASANPVRIEPGRYTTVLEPQAVHGLMTQAVNALDRVTSEQAPMTVYTVHRGLSKIGRPVFDKRITLNTDPLDPVAGYIPFDDDGYPYRAVEWVKDGVLRELGYGRLYALTALGHGIPQQNPFAYRMSGGPTSIAEMVASTERGLLVTRFSGVELLDPPTLLMTGTTRDGVWLIEHGRITKAVANMRFVESPMFVFNKVQQLGPPVRVYSELPVIVPPVKVDDFHFTTLSDSV